jgi:hypothetical protein
MHSVQAANVRCTEVSTSSRARLPYFQSSSSSEMAPLRTLMPTAALSAGASSSSCSSDSALRFLLPAAAATVALLTVLLLPATHHMPAAICCTPLAPAAHMSAGWFYTCALRTTFPCMMCLIIVIVQNRSSPHFDACCRLVSRSFFVLI